MLLAARVTSKGSPSTTFSPPKWSSLTANTLTEASNDWSVRKGAGSSLTTVNVADAFVLDAVDTATVNVVDPSASTTTGNAFTKVKGVSKFNDSNVSGALPSFTTSRDMVASDNMGTSPNGRVAVAKWNLGPTTTASSSVVVNSRVEPSSPTIKPSSRENGTSPCMYFVSNVSDHVQPLVPGSAASLVKLNNTTRSTPASMG